jgi:sulfotransferase
MATNLHGDPSVVAAAADAAMPLLSITSPATIRKCADLPLHDADVFICSYPKSGTTWMQHIVLSLLLRHNDNNNKDDNVTMDSGDSETTTTTTTTTTASRASSSSRHYRHVSELAPFFEIDAHWEGDNVVAWIRQNHQSLGRRVFNTHLRFSMLPKIRMMMTTTMTSQLHQQLGGSGQVTAKIIYLVRSPLDTCVSFYHHLSNQVEGGYNGSSFDEFFDEWLDGKLPFGSWLDHVRSYEDAALTAAASTAAISTGDGSSSTVRLADGRHLLFVSYEHMVHNLDKVVQEVVAFLDLNVSAEQRADLLPTFSFAAMKANIDHFQPKSVHWKNDFCFLRRGVVGDGQDTVTASQHARFRERLEQSRLLQDGKNTYFHSLLRHIITQPTHS